MLRLMLLRHAKSSWNDPGLDDRQRPLSPRGEAAAPAMGKFMRRHDLVPDLVLCSPARRARDTWKLIAKAMPEAPVPSVEEAVYDFGNGGRLLEAIRRRGDKATRVLVVGHNPSIERLALRLVKDGDPDLIARMKSKYPTGALAVIDFAAEAWWDVADTEGKLVSFTRPKDVTKEK
jgi:phosphohistidine phosphatase